MESESSTSPNTNPAATATAATATTTTASIALLPTISIEESATPVIRFLVDEDFLSSSPEAEIPVEVETVEAGISVGTAFKKVARGFTNVDVDPSLCSKGGKNIEVVVKKDEEGVMTENPDFTTFGRHEDEDETVMMSKGLKRRMTLPHPGYSNPFHRSLSEETKLEAAQAEELEKRLKSLVSAFSERTKRTKEKIKQPPTPSTSESETEDSTSGEANLLERLRLLCSPDLSSVVLEQDEGRRKSITTRAKESCLRKFKMLSTFLSCQYILDADGSFYVGWLVVVSACFLYNALVIPLRAIFPYQTKENLWAWRWCDGFTDFVYLFDIIAFKSHRKFIKEGFWIKEASETRKSYLETLQFKIDLLALFPADIFVSIVYDNYPLLRIPRMLKIETFWELFRRLDTMLASPHSARITHTFIYMLYMIHANACTYYGLSKWEGIGSTTWTFDGEGNAYIKCFYFATKTATSIGKNPKPENEFEYLYMTFAWLSGVFVFAILIGQIRDIIATATKNQTEYRAMTYAAISYLHSLGVPKRLQNRVKLWLSYTWEQQKTFDESKILDLLPQKMQSDVALNLHVETLSKVKLFQNCEVAFLRDLVVKLRSIIFLPGDYVCRKGEIGREMFIVKSGKIHVVGGPSGKHVLAELRDGSVFGEIALLGIGGMNKRTADVRAAGFANLFVLNKVGLEEAIRDYPRSQEIMRRKAKKIMKENIRKARSAAATTTISSSKGDNKKVFNSGNEDTMSEMGDEVIIRNRKEPPKLIEAMMQIFPPNSKIARCLQLGSKAFSTTELFDESLDNYTDYPPSPFIPGSIGNTSPELDISIMTGDSDEGHFSFTKKALIVPIPIETTNPVPGNSNSGSYPVKKESGPGKLQRERVQGIRLKSGSSSSTNTEELEDYLDADERGSLLGLNKLICSTEQTSQCPSSVLTLNSTLKSTEFSSSISHGSRESISSDISDSNSVFTSISSLDGEHRSINRPVGRNNNEMKMLSIEMESVCGERKLRAVNITDREVLPVSSRPPIYPIVLGDFPVASLSSSEESLGNEQEEGSSGSYEVQHTFPLKQSKTDMTPRTAAIIASRFLTKAKKVKVPLKRQSGVDRVSSLDRVSENSAGDGRATDEAEGTHGKD